jgi:hypothetical protein
MRKIRARSPARAICFLSVVPHVPSYTERRNWSRWVVGSRAGRITAAMAFGRSLPSSTEEETTRFFDVVDSCRHVWQIKSKTEQLQFLPWEDSETY